MINLHDVARELNDEPVVEPTPVETLYRRAATLRRRSLLVRAGTGALAVGAAAVIAIAVISAVNNDNGVGTTPATQPKVSVSAIGWPTSFVSTRVDPNGRGVAVDVSNVRTGAVLKTIADISTTDGTSVTGTAITAHGHVWVTLNRGPTMVGRIAGGDPKPHTCASEVRDYDPKNGRYTTVLRGGDDELLSDVQPSPTDDRVAYLHSGCATYYFDNAVQVMDLTTGHVEDVSPSDLPRCHLIDDPRWSKDGSAVAYVYGYATTENYTGPNGTCSEVGPAIVQVDAVAPGGDSARSKLAACSTSALAVSGDGYTAIERCGPAPSFVSGYVHLVRYDSRLRAISAVALGRCENGASIAGTPKSSDVVISMYQFCGGNALPPPATNVFVASNAGVRKILAVPGGETALDHLSY
jgi:hypothetical protein